MKLFCFPYAGGLPSIYYKWLKPLEMKNIDLKPVEYRSQLFSKNREEPLLNSIEDIVNYAYKQVINEVSDQNFAFFGHSMGGIVAFELTRKLIAEDNIKPSHLILSASRPPHMYKDLKKTYDLPINDFIDELRKLGGTPEDVLNNNELLELIIPTVQADFQAIQTYRFDFDQDIKLPVNFSVFYGKEDNIKIEEIIEWQKYCKSACRFYSINGDHFFIHSRSKDLIDSILNVLEEKE